MADGFIKRALARALSGAFNLPVVPAPVSHRVTRGELARRQIHIVNATRRFSAAEGGNLLGGWAASNNSLDVMLRSQLPTLRARSRDLCLNNAYAKQFLRKVSQNVIGPRGIQFQARAMRDNGGLDVQDNDRIEAAYALSSRRGNFDVTGQLSRAEGERLAAEVLARDGEVLVRFVRNFPNEVGFAVEFLDANRLDWSYNIDRLPNGNRVVMGVEKNGFGAPVAYYILSQSDVPTVINASQTARVRVDASDILHLFCPLSFESSRGVPWMHAAIVELRHHGGYKEAAVVAARVGAEKLGFIRGGDAEPLDGEEASDGSVILPSGPGEFGQLPDDADIVDWQPDYPHQQFESFNRAMLQGVASGFGVSYPTFASDLIGVNFSSMRGGVLDERDTWMCIQDFFVSGFSRRHHIEWLSWGLLSGKIPDLRPLPLSRLNKFRAADFIPRRWQWVDPLKDEQANDLGVARRSRSVSSIIREAGQDPEEVWTEIAAEQQRMKELGIAPQAPKPPSPPKKPGDDDEAEDGTEQQQEETSDG